MSAMPFGGGSRWRLHRRDGEADACLGEAHAHLEAHRRDAARSAVRRALRADLNLAESLEAARLLHVLDETQAAVDLYHALLRDAGDEPSSLTVRAALLMVLGRYEEAVAPLRALVGQCPDDPEGHLQLAQALARTGDRKGAIASARQARRVAPPWPDLHLVVGRLMLRLDAQIEARAALEAAHRMDPEDATLTLTIGRTWARAGAYAEALTMFEAVLERHPGSLDGLVEAGLTYARLGRREDTARCQQILERLHPGRPDARRRLENALAESTRGQRRQPPPLPALPAATGNREEVADEAILEVSDDASADVPPGLSSVVPAPGDRQGFSGVTTGEVEAALGTLDLVIDDSLGAWSDIANGSIEVALLPPPLRLEEATGSPAPRTPSVPPPLASAPPAPGPAVVHAPEADDDSLTGDSFDEAFEALFAAVPPAESDRVASDLDSEAVTRTTASSVSSMDDLPMTAALDDEDDSVDVGYGGSGEALIEPEESEAPVPAPAPEDDPPPALLPGGSRRAEADPFDAPPPLVADIGVDRGPVHSARPDARAELPESLRSGSFALLAPPHPRPASPPLTPVAEDALP
ncbi:MAG: tetratricopeptide repeat protein, partial [Myxococcales bacterium]|nr:tetratricopeptide repeat protein [Myxococcales bacterium]